MAEPVEPEEDTAETEDSGAEDEIPPHVNHVKWSGKVVGTDEFSLYGRGVTVPMPLALIRAKRLSPGAKLCFSRLVLFSGEYGYAWPGMKKLAFELGISVRQAKRYIADLLEYGLIRVYDRRHMGQSNLYSFLRHPIFTDTPARMPSAGTTEDPDAPREAPPTRKGTNAAPSPNADGDTYGPNPGDTCGPTPKREERRKEEGREAALASLETAAPRGSVLKTARDDADGEKRKFRSETRTSTSQSPRVPVGAPGNAPRPKWMVSGGDDEPFGGDPDEEGPAEEPERPVEARLASVAALVDPAALQSLRAAQAARGTRTIPVESVPSAKAKASRRAPRKSGADDGLRDLTADEEKWLPACQRVWREEFQRRDPDIVIGRWLASEWKKVRELFNRYDGETVFLVLRYVVREWDKITVRYLKKQGDLTLGFVVRFHDGLVQEAKKWEKHADVLVAYKDWSKNNQDEPYPPSELRAQYLVARKELEALGF